MWMKPWRGSCKTLSRNLLNIISGCDRRKAWRRGAALNACLRSETKNGRTSTVKCITIRGLCPWGIQTGPFAACQAYFCPKCFHLLPFILRGPISNYPRERKEGRKVAKRNLPKVNETQGFLYLGQSNWTICSLLSWFDPKNFPHFSPALHNKPFLITPERRRKEGAGAENGEKGITRNWKRNRVSDLWAFKLDHLQPVKLILFKDISTFYQPPHNKPFRITPEREENGRSRGTLLEIQLHFLWNVISCKAKVPKR